MPSPTQPQTTHRLLERVAQCAGSDWEVAKIDLGVPLTIGLVAVSTTGHQLSLVIAADDPYHVLSLMRTLPALGDIVEDGINLQRVWANEEKP